MSRAELRAGAVAFAAYLANPPGWIPAWATLAFLIATGWRLQLAALSADVALERVTAALAFFKEAREMYVTTLSVWLGYRGVGGIVEAFKAVLEARAAAAARCPEPEKGAAA